MPNSWMGIDIDPQMVKFITNVSLHESIQLPGEPPLNGPAAVDMWLDAAEGDSSGMALVSLFVWGIARGWPETDDQSVGEVQESDFETLLISGTLDGSTPMQHARDELTPFLSRGHQVFIEDQAHTETFWHSQPQARAQLLNTFFDRGAVDDSRYEYQAPVFKVETGWSELAKIAMAILVLGFGLAVVLIFVIARKLVRASATA